MYIITKNNVIVDYSENFICLKQNPKNKLLVGCTESEANFYGMNDNIYPAFTGHNTEAHVLHPVDSIPDLLDSDGSWCYNKENKTFSQDESLLKEVIHAKRCMALAETDYTDFKSYVFKPEEEVWGEQIKTYRQAWRDITEQDGYPFEVEYPVLPVNTYKLSQNTGTGEENQEE